MTGPSTLRAHLRALIRALVAAGRTDREIAALQGASTRTVAGHVGRVLAKLGA